MEHHSRLLESGLQGLKLDLNEPQKSQLIAFVQLLIKWNKTYNLTAITQPNDILRLHILDSLAIVPYLQGDKIADIGTGAGLPGIPLAIAQPNRHFCLIDANAKKTRFVQQAILELKLSNVEVIHGRVEKIKPKQPFSTVITRAFASLPKIISLTTHLIDQQGILLAMKGQKPIPELEQLTIPYSMLPMIIPGVDAQRCLIKLTGEVIHG